LVTFSLIGAQGMAVKKHCWTSQQWHTRKFGDSVRAKNARTILNETLAKFVCHNLCCLIQSMEEFGIDPTFKRIAV
jgi:hypothetical protein